MRISNNPHMQKLIARSQLLDSTDWNDVDRLLVPALQRAGWTSEDVLAIGHPGRSLLAVRTGGHVRISEKGFLRPRVELEKVNYQEVAWLKTSERGVRGRDGSFIEGLDGKGNEIFAFGWNSGGGSIEYADMMAARAAAERDRIFAVIRPLVEGAA